LSQLPTLFCLHALGASAREFDAVADELAGAFDVVALDLPGFGDASGATGLAVDDLVASVERAIRRHGSTRWALVGHSMGGKVASLVAARALAGTSPLFGLAGVVLLAASPPVPEPMDEERRERMLSWVADGPLDDAAAREFVDGNVGSPLSPAADAVALDGLRRTSPDAWSAWLTRGSREDRSHDVGVLDLPALILAGGADGDLGEAAQRELNGRAYPRATVHVLPGAGHLLPLERPHEVAEAIATFWRERADLGPVVPADFAKVVASGRTTSVMRGTLARRAVADDPDRAPRALDATQLATLRVVADRVVPQDGPAIDLAARLDEQLAEGRGDGWRVAGMPSDVEAYRLALDALSDLDALDDDARDAVLRRVDEGSYEAPTTGRPAATSLTPEQFSTWFEDCRVDLVKHWLSHPATMERVGFDGFATGGDLTRFEGWLKVGADEREGWEPALPPRSAPLPALAQEVSR